MGVGQGIISSQSRRVIGPDQSKKVKIESIFIDYEQLLGKLKKHLKRVQCPDIATIKYFVHDYLYPKNKTKKVYHVNIDDPLVIEVTNILYDLSPRVKRIVDLNKDKLNGSYDPFNLPKIKAPFPEFPIFKAFD